MFFRSFFLSYFSFLLCLPPLLALNFFSFFFFLFSRLLLVHPLPSPTDSPLKLSCSSRPSFLISRPHRDTCNPLFLVALTVLSSRLVTVGILSLFPNSSQQSSSYEMHDSISPFPSHRPLPKSIRIDHPRLQKPADLGSIAMAAFTWARRRVLNAHLALFPFLFFLSRIDYGISKTREFITTNPPTFTYSSHSLELDTRLVFHVYAYSIHVVHSILLLCFRQVSRGITQENSSSG